MQFNISKKLFFITTLSLFFVGCSQKNNSVDIDLSNLPKPKKDKLIKKVDQTKLKPLDKKFISDLVQLEDKEQVIDFIFNIHKDHLISQLAQMIHCSYAIFDKK